MKLFIVFCFLCHLIQYGLVSQKLKDIISEENKEGILDHYRSDFVARGLFEELLADRHESAKKMIT